MISALQHGNGIAFSLGPIPLSCTATDTTFLVLKTTIIATQNVVCRTKQKDAETFPVRTGYVPVRSTATVAVMLGPTGVSQGNRSLEIDFGVTVMTEELLDHGWGRPLVACGSLFPNHLLPVPEP
ncbi:hypothetical protein CkaCkLH20_00992 [Colletotrichum karsti]|uniref:Uncharacterized protein n=1 Tax=Colletotrichum karsti TaxID=1095194 RepID=A0A9P6IGU4_9PEZI|nr:uncharacterized protein CkaCkLH20_00992 [Colletotrichum karsti]KAF9881846.1 hypothetical protein CkaCkLH20_00992 [Colletotrichum karsti]